MTRLTREQAAILGAYTGVLCGPMSDLGLYINRIVGRPVFTHELGQQEMADKIADLAKADFLAIVAEVAADSTNAQP